MFMLFLINASTKDKKKYIKHIRPCFTAFPNTEKRVESTTRSGVFLSEGKRRSKEGGAKEEDRVHGNSNGAGLHVITP